MDVIRWLEENAPGFSDLSLKEREAPMHFSLVWSYFEAVALGASGDTKALSQYVQALASSGLLRREEIEPCLVYFRDRYYDGSDFSSSFAFLNLRKSDNPSLVKSVLAGHENGDVPVFTAVLTVIYRFRNNLLHGEKWAYSLRDQLGNFNHATCALIAVMGMARRGHA